MANEAEEMDSRTSNLNEPYPIPRFLYRGVNPDLYRNTDGKLIPKACGEVFKRGAYYGEAYWDDGSVYGESDRNAVIVHQRDSSKHHTSGVSTTPIREKAVRYATHNEKYPSGYVFKIDTTLLEANGVTAYSVAEHATQPALPNDQEIILVAKDFGALPDAIIVEVVEV